MEFFLILGNNGYPVTHFWVHQEDGIYFESKGTHDHFRPQARRATPDRSSINKQSNAKQNSEQDESTEEKTEKREVKCHVLHDTKMRQARAIARSNHMQFHQAIIRTITRNSRALLRVLLERNHLGYNQAIICNAHVTRLCFRLQIHYHIFFLNEPVK